MVIVVSSSSSPYSRVQFRENATSTISTSPSSSIHAARYLIVSRTDSPLLEIVKWWQFELLAVATQSGSPSFIKVPFNHSAMVFLNLPRSSTNRRSYNHDNDEPSQRKTATNFNGDVSNWRSRNAFDPMDELARNSREIETLPWCWLNLIHPTVTSHWSPSCALCVPAILSIRLSLILGALVIFLVIRFALGSVFLSFSFCLIPSLRLISTKT